MMVHSFSALFATHQAIILDYRYAILLGVCLMEGTGTMLTAGALIAAGIFTPIGALAVCTVAEIVDGFVWYAVGYWFGAKPIEYFVRNSPRRQAFLEAVRRYSDRSAGLVVLAVKLTYSVTNPTLILIGSLKYDIKRYTFYNVIGSVGWAAILLSLGYTFGRAAFTYLHVFRQAGLAVFVVIAFLLLLVALRELSGLLVKYMRGHSKEA